MNHDDKRELVNVYKQYLNRKILFTNEINLNSLEELINMSPVIFYKPYDGDSGKGILKLSLKNFSNVNEMYNYVKALPEGLLEEAIIQSEEMNKLNPYCVQTVRFMVYKHEKGARLIFTTLRTPIKKMHIKTMQVVVGFLLMLIYQLGK